MPQPLRRDDGSWLEHPRMNTSVTPPSDGRSTRSNPNGANLTQRGDPAIDTASTRRLGTGLS
jgi:hypothetical protein